MGDELVGRVVDFLGRPYPLDSPAAAAAATAGTQQHQQQPIGTSAQLPLFNAQPDMESREQIAEPLLTGVRALDVLTPLGRGQAQQVVGPAGSGKSQLCVDAVMGQRGAGVRCVYAAVGCSRQQLQRTLEQMAGHGCLEYTTVVAATGDRWVRGVALLLRL